MTFSAVVLFTVIFAGTFGILGLVFLGVGLGITAANGKKRSRCTAYAEGTVSAMQCQGGSSGLRAVYSFLIDGKQMQYVSNYSGVNNLLVGQSVRVYYDPENIGCVYIEEDVRAMRLFMRVFTILGAAFLTVAIVAAVLAFGLV